MCHIFFNFSSIHGHVGWFHVLTIVNAPLHVGGKIPLQHTDVISFGCTPNSGIARLYSCSIFCFLRNLHTAFHNGCTNFHSHQQCASVPFSPYHHQHLLSFVFLVIAILIGVKWYLIVVLNCTSLMVSDAEHFFHILVGHFCVSFWEVSIQVPCPCIHFTWIIWLYAIEMFEFLCIFDFNQNLGSFGYWPSFCRLSLHSVHCFLCHAEPF